MHGQGLAVGRSGPSLTKHGCVVCVRAMEAQRIPVRSRSITVLYLGQKHFSSHPKLSKAEGEKYVLYTSFRTTELKIVKLVRQKDASFYTLLEGS